MGDALPAVDLGPGETIIQLSIGLWHSCALRLDGEVKCWGLNDSGQLGLGDTKNRGDQVGEMGVKLPAVHLVGGNQVTQIVTGSSHTCVLRKNGDVQCWGWNKYGQLGYGDTILRGTHPTHMGSDLPKVDLGTGVKAVELAAGDNQTCARLLDGRVKCWGANESGQLGLGDTNDRGDEPGEMGDALPAVDLGPGNPLAQLSRGGTHVCVLREGGEVKCWGDNEYGQLGLGDAIDRGTKPGDMGASLLAAKLPPTSTPVQLIGGYKHACVRRLDGKVLCWGANEYGQLGLGDLINRGNKPDQMGLNLTTVPLPEGSPIVQIAAGDRFTCVRHEDSHVQCWGQGDYGQLGLGDTEQRGDQPGEVESLPFIDLGH